MGVVHGREEEDFPKKKIRTNTPHTGWTSRKRMIGWTDGSMALWLSLMLNHRLDLSLQSME